MCYNTFMKKIFSIILLTPFYVFAAGPLLPNCAPDCKWQDFITLANNVLQFMIYLAVIVSAVMFAYAGFLYLTSGGSADKVKKAHSVFWSVFVGIIITLVAWVAVDTLLNILTGKGVQEWSKPEAFIEKTINLT